MILRQQGSEFNPHLANRWAQDFKYPVNAPILLFHPSFMISLG